MFDSYRNTSLLKLDQCLIVLIDMQEALLRGISGSERIVERAQLLLQGAGVLRAPVLVTTQNAEKLGPLAAPLQAALPPRTPRFDKLSFSCCGSTDFCLAVERSGRKQIVLCGVEAHICVSQTAHDLTQAGFQVHLAADTIASRSEADRQAGMEKMRQSGVLVSSVEMALYELLGKAGTPEFREILKLVR